ncbi:MAG TPA: efflux RND transporter periplasmic adaptor subunit [Paracoccaceae bacterium]|nr:efflux RND transporter periplasmic adaptor subunit [Paracoccaceae bacterium]
MRILPFLTALVVTAFLYLLVAERDVLMALAGAETPAEATSAPADPVAAPEAVRRVSVVAVDSLAQSVDSAVLARGLTEAMRMVEMRAETGGRVASPPLRRGTTVQAGDALCVIDPGNRPDQLAEAQARVAEARARLAEAEMNDRAARQLSQGGFASETRVAATEAAVESARAGVVGAEADVAAIARDIDRLTIRAPFAGVLETDTAELGALLQPGSACATVLELDPIKLVGFVSEAEIDRVTLGAMAGARLVSGRQVTGTVTFVARSADPQTRTFRVEVTVANPDRSIRDGQTAEMLIAAEGSSAHLLPSSALTLDDTGRLGLRIVDDAKTARFVPVTVLRDTADGVWLTGLPDRATVIVVGQEFVTDGAPVDVTLREDAQ